MPWRILCNAIQNFSFATWEWQKKVALWMQQCCCFTCDKSKAKPILTLSLKTCQPTAKKWQNARSHAEFLFCTKSDFETGKGCVFNEQNLPVSKTHSLVIKPQEVKFKWSQNGNRPTKSRLRLLLRGHTKQLWGFVVVRWGYRCYFTVKIDQQI